MQDLEVAQDAEHRDNSRPNVLDPSLRSIPARRPPYWEQYVLQRLWTGGSTGGHIEGTAINDTGLSRTGRNKRNSVYKRMAWSLPEHGAHPDGPPGISLGGMVRREAADRRRVGGIFFLYPVDHSPPTVCEFYRECLF